MRIALAGGGIAIAASATMLAPSRDGARRALERPGPVVLRPLAAAGDTGPSRPRRSNRCNNGGNWRG
jgi:hypothetical protein